MAGVRGWGGVAGSSLGFFGSKPARTPRQGHNGPTTQALLVEGHTKDDPSSPAARPGDPLSTASDSSERRSPARDAAGTPLHAGAEVFRRDMGLRGPAEC